MGSSSLALPLRAWTSGLDRRCRLLTATNTMFTRVTVAFVSCCRANYSEWNMTPHPLSALAFDHWAVLCSVQKREGWILNGSLCASSLASEYGFLVWSLRAVHTVS